MIRTLLIFVLGLFVGFLIWSPTKANAAAPDVIIDNAQILSVVEESLLRSQIEKLYKERDIHMVILTIDDLKGQDIAAYVYAKAKEWKLGDEKKDNGLIFAIAPKERKTRFEVGSGLEGILTDANTKVILVDMRPALRENKFYDAFTLAITKVNEHAYLNLVVGEPVNKKKTIPSTTILVFLLIAFIGGIIMLWAFFRSSPKPPKPGFLDLQSINRPTSPRPVSPRSSTNKTYPSRSTQKKNDDDSDLITGAIIGSVIGSSSSSSSRSSRSSSSSSSSSDSSSSSFGGFDSSGGSFSGGGSSDSY